MLGLLSIALGFQSCKNKDADKTEDTTVMAKTLSKECFKAVYEADTLDLQINTLEGGKISGTMDMNIANMPKKSGELVGEFSGDTLYASYTFTQGANKKVTFKNPMAFLKRGTELILGNGQIATSMGASYFVKGTKIDYDNVKYKFSPIECMEIKPNE